MHDAHRAGKKIAIAFGPPEQQSAIGQWHQLVGIAKYLARTGTAIPLAQLTGKLNLGPQALALGLHALESVGFQVNQSAQTLQIQAIVQPSSASPQCCDPIIHRFLAAVEEEQFRQRYFQDVPLETIEAIGQQVSIDEQNHGKHH